VRSDYHICRLILQRQVVDCQELFLDIFQVNAERLITLLCGISHDCAPGAVIQLQISASCIIELVDHILICQSDVLDQFFVCCVEFSGTLEILRNDHLLEHLCRCRDGVLCNSLIVLELFQKLKIGNKRMRYCLDLSGQIGILQRCQLAAELYAGACLLMSYAFKAPHEIQMPVFSSVLAVGDDVIACLLLLGNQFTNGIIFYCGQLFLADFSSLVILSSLLQTLRTQETSDKVIAIRRCDLLHNRYLFLFNGIFSSLVYQKQAHLYNILLVRFDIALGYIALCVRIRMPYKK